MSKIHLEINSREYEVEQERSILEACREVGVEIPTLCYHPALEPYGACRLCMVEVSMSDRPFRLMAACVTPCADGMKIRTETETVKNSRKLTAELLLAEAPDNEEIRRIAEETGVQKVRYITEDSDNCVLCSLCVRSCKEIVGVNAISTIYRGINKRVSPPFQLESDICIGCGTCILVCPTNALDFNHITGYSQHRLAIFRQDHSGSQTVTSTSRGNGNGRHG